MESRDTTIAAISTGLVPSGISIIRMSGPDAVAVADRVFIGTAPLSDAKSHTIHHGTIVFNGETLDETLVSVMRAPHTYTGEDVVEINCHGGVLVTERVLSAVLGSGAVPASPGEFTKRAFLNGKMELDRAEAVAEVIQAESDLALRSSVAMLRGKLTERVRALRERLLDQIAFIEAALDDPEHYDVSERKEEIESCVFQALSEIDEWIRSGEEGKIVREGVRTVILGRPNAGKSSLFNLLLGVDSAIVTDVPGTTRDVLEERVSIGGLTLVLLDTAGLRQTEETVEKIGVSRAKEARDTAALELYVIDGTEGMTEEDRQNLSEPGPAARIVVINKADVMTEEEKAAFGTDGGCGGEAPSAVLLSAKTGEGLSELKDAILKLFLRGAVGFGSETVIANKRQLSHLWDAKEALLNAKETIDEAVGEEFLSAELSDAYSALGFVIGESVSDDVIDRVFEKFCMGK